MTELSDTKADIPVAIFVNLQAGGGRARKYLPAIEKIFVGRSIPAEFIVTSSREELEAHARKLIQAGHRVFVAMGGDGTLQALVNATYGVNVLLGIIPIGGGNDFAAALGLPRNPLRATDAMLTAKPRVVDLLRARTGDGRERLYIGGGGLGLDADAARYASGTYARVPGRARYLASALRALSSFESLRVGAEFPGSDLPRFDAQVLVAGALNTPTYGAGLRLAPEARMDDGLMSAILVKDLSAAKIAALLPRLLFRGDLPESVITRVSTRCVRFSTDRDCLFHADGEILGHAPVEIEVVPAAARIFAARQ